MSGRLRLHRVYFSLVIMRVLNSTCDKVGRKDILTVFVTMGTSHFIYIKFCDKDVEQLKSVCDKDDKGLGDNYCVNKCSHHFKLRTI